ncbi:hypothetical protein ACQBAR_09205 [Propionibacteriaceae bacterium Y1685]
MTFSPRTGALLLTVLAPFILTACSQTQKPEAAELNAALVALYTSQETNLDQATAQKLADCVTPQFMEQLDATTLNAIVEGKERGGKKEDEAKITSITQGCSSELV